MTPHDIKPTLRQLRYLRHLAETTGTTFAQPSTRAEASKEIERLRRHSPSPRHEREGDRRAVGDAIVEQQPASSVRDDEVTGYGSSARWA